MGNETENENPQENNEKETEIEGQNKVSLLEFLAPKINIGHFQIIIFPNFNQNISYQKMLDQNFEAKNWRLWFCNFLMVT